MSEVVEIKTAVEKDILSISGITGIGVGKSSPEKINIYVKTLCPNVISQIPSQIGGVDVRIIETGKILALPFLQAIAQQVATEVMIGAGKKLVSPLFEGAAQQQVVQAVDRTARWRPYMGGVSTGHISTTAGTLATKVYDAATGEVLLLSNNHVFANMDSKQNLRALKNDHILQPGAYDGGQFPTDKIAELERWVKLDEDISEEQKGSNTIDAAVARPMATGDVKDEIIGIGKVTEMAVAKVGQIVRKSGRTTEVTSGVIIDNFASIKISYGSFTATFKDQLIITPAIASGGDSGSLLVNSDNRAVGLVFAGSQFITSANKITNVAKALNIHLGNPQVYGEETEGKGGFWGTVPALMGLGMFGMMKVGQKVSDRKLKTKPMPASKLGLKYYGGK